MALRARCDDGGELWVYRQVNLNWISMFVLGLDEADAPVAGVLWAKSNGILAAAEAILNGTSVNKFEEFLQSDS